MNAWQEILGFLKAKVNPQSYQTWLRPTRFSHVADGSLVVRVPNRNFQDWIEEKYGSLITQALADLNSAYQRISYVVDDSPEAKSERSTEHKAVQGSLDFDSPAHLLDARYTFDAFVVGSCNQFAHAAARAVAQTPANRYNPLFLYGGVGLGKTHLMHAIGHLITSQWKEMRLAYVSSEAFTNEVVNSLRYDRMFSLREKYRRVDVLLVDDIEFIAGKERTQDEFFHTFNDLYQAHKQVVISSDSPPKDIPAMEERLVSRFAWGLTADLQPPDLETKMAILGKKAEMGGFTLPPEVVEFIASKINASIRDLEGALNRLQAYSSMSGEEISLGMAHQLLKTYLDQDERRISIENIQRAVCREYGMSLGQLKSKNNSHKVAYPRQIAMYLAKQLTPTSLPQIGREFGGKHHTTVLHSINKIAEQRKSDKDLNRVINKLTAGLN
ncbi:MAG: chromosomal replication initiator protein DnaA [Acidobacteriota bacterium]|nr:chromosomal replication initiator protein DnaA [Acidobacteriota bacterium]